MEKYLTILEVSQKQAYIFASKRLRENAARSDNIKRVTSSEFFGETVSWYSKDENLVYAGGGHTVLQFESEEKARLFAMAVTGAVLREYPALELFVKTIPYDPNIKTEGSKTKPGANLEALSRTLERKKALRAASFRQVDFGLEKEEEETVRGKTKRCPHSGYEYPAAFEDLPKALPEDKRTRADNFIAVVHIDGNAMGTRVNEIYEKHPEDWEACRADLRMFSEQVDQDFEGALDDTVREVIRALQLEAGLPGQLTTLPVRPVIQAGDDVCFVTAGSIGLECARVFLEKLSRRCNPRKGGKPYAACAGVALVHTKYPFYRAYALAEELCSNAKRYGASLDEAGGVSAMDWHIEFGQLKDSLARLREDYQTEDGCRLELRPVTVRLPEKAPGDGARPAEPPAERTYAYFRALCNAMRQQQKENQAARSKLKELRTALRQGETEAGFFLQEKQIADLLYLPLDAAPLKEAAQGDANQGKAKREEEQRREEALWKALLQRLRDKAAFRPFAEPDGEVRRCLFFDALELLDHFIAFEEVPQ